MTLRSQQRSSSRLSLLARLVTAGSRFANMRGIYLGRRATKVHVALYRLSRGRRGCPRSRRTLNGGPPASSARLASVTGANQVREDRRNRHEEGTRAEGRHDLGGDREPAPSADPGGTR